MDECPHHPPPARGVHKLTHNVSARSYGHSLHPRASRPFGQVWALVREGCFGHCCPLGAVTVTHDLPGLISFIMWDLCRRMGR